MKLLGSARRREPADKFLGGEVNCLGLIAMRVVAPPGKAALDLSAPNPRYGSTNVNYSHLLGVSNAKFR